MQNVSLIPNKLGLKAIVRALQTGYQTLNLSRRVSFIFSGIVALAGLLIMRTLWSAGMLPMLPLAAAAFMLVAPVLLAGFFGVARSVECGRPATFKDVVDGFCNAPPVLLVLSLVCTLLFMIFATDIAILYSFQIGGANAVPLEALALSERIAGFWWWGSLSGVFVGLIVFSISAFSVPLICEGRAGLVQSITTSVRGVFANSLVSLVWATLITVVTVISILLLPLLLFTLPTLAYASHALYREIFRS